MKKHFIKQCFVGLCIMMSHHAYAQADLAMAVSKPIGNSEPASLQQMVTVTGQVTENGEAMPGVNVVVKGTTTGTVTNLDGKYSIAVLNTGVTLHFSFVGYISQEFVVGNQTIINVSLAEESVQIGEVVVVGFGASMRKADLSAAIASVENLEQLKERPLTNATDLLQGQVAGVTVASDGGDPSKSASIVIRGKGSNGSESPLWVVDGVPGAPLNINDIETMVVLKDAASAAIYGAHSGSAGVILVTTKKGKAGPPSISYEGSYGVSSATNLPQSLTIDEERRVREMSQVTLQPGWDPVKNPYISQNRTDWMDEIFRPAFFQRHHVALSGGNKEFTNRLSLQYSDKQGTLENTFSKGLTMRYDAAFQLNKYIRIREDFHWENTNSRGANTESGQTGVILSALMMPRNAEAYYSDGTYGGTAPKDQAYIDMYGSNFADIHGDVVNPLRTLGAESQFRRNSRVSTSTFLDIIDPIPGLKFTSRFTYVQTNFFYKRFQPRRTEPGKPNDISELMYEASHYYKWETENTINYDRYFGKHNIGALFSTTANQQRTKRVRTALNDFTYEDPKYQYFQWGSKLRTPEDFYENPDNNVSLIGRLSYSWNNRYFATASYRRDYAGRLPDGKKYGDFPAVTAAWKISEESFMPQFRALSLFKIRASWGRIGNLASIPFAYGNHVLNTVTSGLDVGGQVGSDTPLVPLMVYYGEAFNSRLTWETSEQTDIGFDLNLFQDRLSFTMDYYLKRTFDLIKRQDFGWPNYIGIEPQFINEGEVRNSGFEFSVGWSDKAGPVSYFVNANLATLKNRVHSIGPADPVTGNKPVWIPDDNFRGVLKPYRTPEGEPINSYWLVKTDGMFQSDQDVLNHVNRNGDIIQPNAKPGDLKYIDENNDGKIDDNDRVYMGGFHPKVTYAFTGGLTWKNLSFSMMLQGIGGAKAFHASKYALLNESVGNFNRWNKILDAYPNSTDVPRISADDPNNNFSTNSDWYLEDASYLRIKNISITYSLTHLLYRMSDQLKERNSSLTVLFSADNVYTFTKYTGIDPEVGGIGMDGGRYPVPRIFSFGVKLTY